MRALGVFSRVSHFLVTNTTARVSGLWLANIIVFVAEGILTPGLLVVKVHIDGGRARSALSWQLRVPVLEFLRLEDLIEMLFKKTDILSVALDGCVGKIANEGDEADDEIDGKVDHHHKQNARWETAFDLSHFQDQVECEEGIGSIANSGNKANDRGPTESHAKDSEEGVV